MVGQVAVAQVIVNRVYDERFPNTVCDVVKQGEYYTWNKSIPIKHRCQFSFWCDGKPEVMRDETAKQWSYNVAESALAGLFYDTTSGATHYHADYVVPDWSKNSMFTKTVQINAHIFYRWER
jgi:spore germination cell wall hydrolase CwlJ-like protein